jgi:hypothetical protein
VAVSTGLNKKNCFAVWLLLPLITLGIYQLVWHYKVNNALRERGVGVVPFLSTLALIFPIANLVTVFRTGRRLKDAGYGVEPWVGLILAFIFGLHVWYYQAAINARATLAPAAYPAASAA